MAVPASAPLPVVFVSSPDAGAPPPHGLIGGGRLHSELLCAEVAACVAAVGHRLHVLTRAEASSEDAIAAVGRPTAVLWGLDPSETSLPDPLRGLPPGIRALPVSLGGSAEPHEGLSLPEDSRKLCRTLARTTPDGRLGGAPGQAVVVVHQGPGSDGDARWPGLTWALTLLWGGPGRGLLVDAQGPDGGLSNRLRPLAPLGADRIGWQSAGGVPVPGPALASQLPSAGGVRWWGWTAPRGTPGGGQILWDAPEQCLETARESFAWTVVDVGRDVARARDAADRGTPVVLCTEEPPPADLPLHPEVVLCASGAQRRPGTASTPVPGTVPTTVPLRASDWAGASVASWGRSARRGSGRRLAAETGLRLERQAGQQVDQRTGTGHRGELAERIRP